MNTGYKIAAGAALVVGAYLVYKYFSKPDKIDQQPIPGGGGGSVPPPKPLEQDGGSFPIMRGSKGALVKELQGYILKKDPRALPRYGADGDWGTETENAVYRLFFSLVTIKGGKTSVDTREQMNKIKEAAKPVYTPGSPLVYQYQAPKSQIPGLFGLQM